jgi:DNA-binding NarL/FixJ family response regulator
VSNNLPTTLNILIVATDPLVQQGATTLLRTQSTWHAQALHHDQINELRDLDCRPDISLVSIDSLTGNEIRCIRQLKKAGIRVVAYGTAGIPGLVRKTINIGADAFVDIGASPESIISAIAACALGRSLVIAGNETQRLLKEASHAHNPETITHPHLTNREQELLELIAKGLTNNQIAEHLHIKVGTVKSHVTSMLRKLGLSGRTQLALATNSDSQPPTRNKSIT